MYRKALSCMAFLLALAFMAPAHAQAPKKAKQQASQPKNNAAAWDMGSRLMNHAIGYLPAPGGFVGGFAWNGVYAAANLYYNAVRVSVTEDREMGNGEAWATVLNAFNPIPFTNLTSVAHNMWKGKNLCKERDYRNYPGVNTPELNRFPQEARAAWYEERYCGAPQDHRWDALRREAGLKATSYSASPLPRRGVISIRTYRVLTAPFSAEPENVRQWWPGYDFDVREIRHIEVSSYWPKPTD